MHLCRPTADIQLEEITASKAVRLLIDHIRDSKPGFRPTAANAAHCAIKNVGIA